MSVSAVLVTRGDVPMGPVLDSLPPEWEKIVWDNGNGGNPASVGVRVKEDDGVWVPDFTRYSYVTDLGVYGRYAGVEYASHDLCFIQDDDVLVSDPRAIVNEWLACEALPEDHPGHPHACHVVCNMPQEFRHSFYEQHALVGFGAAFHRDAPTRAFERAGFDGKMSPFIDEDGWTEYVYRRDGLAITYPEPGFVRRTADVLFTTLAPKALVDVPKVNREFAEDEGRMYRQPGHVEERQRMLELARRVRDA